MKVDEMMLKMEQDRMKRERNVDKSKTTSIVFYVYW